MAESIENFERRVFQALPADLSNVDLVAYLGSRYTPEPVPPCPVCGGKLEVVSAGGGKATQYACPGQEADPNDSERLRFKPGRLLADDHYAQSRWTRYRSGDGLVLELLARFERVQKQSALGG